LNMLTVAHLAGVSALQRTESRGVHYRTDYPEANPGAAKHTVLSPLFEEGRLHGVDVRSVPAGASSARTGTPDATPDGSTLRA